MKRRGRELWLTVQRIIRVSGVFLIYHLVSGMMGLEIIEFVGKESSVS